MSVGSSFERLMSLLTASDISSPLLPSIQITATMKEANTLIGTWSARNPAHDPADQMALIKNGTQVVGWLEGIDLIRSDPSDWLVPDPDPLFPDDMMADSTPLLDAARILSLCQILWKFPSRQAGD